MPNKESVSEVAAGATQPARVTHAPALSLPWARVDGDVIQPEGSGSPICGAYGSTSNPRIAQDMDYVVHACNNYGRLVEALREAGLQLEYLHDKYPSTSTGEAVITRTNILLRELGESA